MTRDEANRDLDNYHHLHGKYSTNYEAIVVAVFVSQTEESIAKTEYKALFEGIGISYPDHHTDKFQVWAKIGDKYVPANSVLVR
jgi:hypothetical protein